MELELGSAFATFACVLELELALVWAWVMQLESELGSKLARVTELVLERVMGCELVLLWVWVLELVLAWDSRRYKTLHSKGHFQRQRRCKRLRQRSRCFR